MVALSLFNHFASLPSVIFFCILSITCGLLVLALPCFQRSPCWMNAFSSHPFHDRFSDSFGPTRKIKRHIAHAFVLLLGWNFKRFPSMHHTCELSMPLPRIERTNVIHSRFAPYHAPAPHRCWDHLVCSSSCSPFHPKLASLLPLDLLLSAPRLPRSHNHPPLSALHVLLHPLFRSTQAYISTDLSITRYTLRSVSFGWLSFLLPAQSHVSRLAPPLCFSRGIPLDRMAFECKCRVKSVGVVWIHVETIGTRVATRRSAFRVLRDGFSRQTSRNGHHEVVGGAWKEAKTKKKRTEGRGTHVRNEARTWMVAMADRERRHVDVRNDA